ncbi:MAG: GntR family transcriptional regulator [Geminicoccaceae bacterium]
MALKSLKTERRRLADDVYQQILDAILSNDIGMDDQLVQEKLAAELEISRTPVREALLRLEQDGVLVTSPRGGFMLRRISEDEAKEIYDVRAAVEGQAARILAIRNDAAIHDRLRRLIKREEALTSYTVQAYFAANRNIHRSIVELAGNRHLLDMFDNIWNRAVAFHLFAAIEEIDLSKSLGNHLALIDAIATGDWRIAMETTFDHISDGFELQRLALKLRQGGLDAL